MPTIKISSEPLPPLPARDDWGHEEGQQDGDTGDMFPPGDHPLEGVPNFGDLAVPETLSVKVNLSEVRKEDGHVLFYIYWKVFVGKPEACLFTVSLTESCHFRGDWGAS